MCCQYRDKFIDEYNKHDWSYAAALDDSVNLVRQGRADFGSARTTCEEITKPLQYVTIYAIWLQPGK